MNLELTRIAYMPNVTLGRLKVGTFNFATLEEPWIANPRGPGGMRRDLNSGQHESCVPDGDYVLKPHSGDKFKQVYRLSNHTLGVYDFEAELPEKDEWGRATVLIHNGNTTDNIIGCILVGIGHGELEGKPAVTYSRVALNDLRGLLGNQLHALSIRPFSGTH